MKKKMCLVTYSNSPNYGAALQLFATYKAFEKLNCDVVVLNYENNYEASHNSLQFLFVKKPIKDKIRWLLASFFFGGAKNSKRNFSEFYSKMNYTKKISSAEELFNIEGIDAFCVGSDQVWNPQITNGFDDVFCLRNNFITHKFSYASSMGSANFNDYDTEKFITAMKGFEKISVREEIAAEFVRENISEQVRKVVDPTLLFDSEQWKKIINLSIEKNPIKEKYVLIYALGGLFKESNRIAHEIAERIGAKVAAITLSNRPKGVDYLLNHTTPEEFVQYISNASFVVTNSFHGTCFSIIFGTPFYSIRFNDNPTRAEELLRKYNLQHRMICKGDSLDIAALQINDIYNANMLIKQDSYDSILWLGDAVYGE
ncbi:MAG: polysaccharide pyruvyl transferase family protein [Velocimicrobium sp.]